MTAHVDRAASAPRWVSLFSPMLGALLRRGVPIGPNALVTVPGRTSGVPRSVPLAIIEADDRRWVWSPWGEVHWVRNLRAAGRATITVGGRAEEVRVTELDATARVAFFRDVLGPVAGAMRGGMAFVRVVDGVDLSDPEEVARDRRVFQLHRVP